MAASSSKATAFREQVEEQQASGILDKTLEATQRRQSIRAEAARFLGVPPEKVCDLLRNVWRTSNGQPELTDAEMFSGMSMIARYELDPIAKEIYVTRGKGDKLLTIIGIDGFVKILNRTPGYDGFETDLGFAKDGSVEWAETRIYSTLRSRPTTYRGFAREYAKVAGIVANSLPTHMLRLFTLRHAARLFTPIGGNVVLAEEVEFELNPQQQPSRSQPNRVRHASIPASVVAAPSDIEELPDTAEAIEQHYEPPVESQPAHITEEELELMHTSKSLLRQATTAEQIEQAFEFLPTVLRGLLRNEEDAARKRISKGAKA